MLAAKHHCALILSQCSQHPHQALCVALERAQAICVALQGAQAMCVAVEGAQAMCVTLHYRYVRALQYHRGEQNKKQKNWKIANVGKVIRPVTKNMSKYQIHLLFK